VKEALAGSITPRTGSGGDGGMVLRLADEIGLLQNIGVCSWAIGVNAFDTRPCGGTDAAGVGAIGGEF